MSPKILWTLTVLISIKIEGCMSPAPPSALLGKLPEAVANYTKAASEHATIEDVGAASQAALCAGTPLKASGGPGFLSYLLGGRQHSRM